MKRNSLLLLIIFLVNLIYVNAESIFLSDHLEEGETKVYETKNGIYVVSLLSVADEREKAVFRLNDEMSKGIKSKDSYVFKDGSEIVLRDLVINDATDKNDEAYFYFYGTGKDVLELRNVSSVVDNNLCNFDSQCLNETKENCCYDCGCNEDEKCVNNKCVLIEEEILEEIKKEEVEEKNKEKDIKVEEKKETIEEEKEKKVVYAMLIITSFFVLIIVWFVIKKKRTIF